MVRQRALMRFSRLPAYFFPNGHSENWNIGGEIVVRDSFKGTIEFVVAHIESFETVTEIGEEDFAVRGCVEMN